MTRTKAEETALIYQTAVIVAGLGLWLASVVFLFTGQTPREHLTLLGFLPLIIVIIYAFNSATITSWPPSSPSLHWFTVLWND